MKTQILILLLLAALFTGCRTRTVYLPAETRIDSIHIEKLIPVPVPGDSASLYALLECDEQGRVTLRKLQQEAARNLRLSFILDSLGNLKVEAAQPPDTVFVPSKDIVVTKTEKVPYPVERKLSVWEQIRLDYGGYAIILSVIILAYAIRRWIVRMRQKITA